MKFIVYYVYTILQVVFKISATLMDLQHYHPLTEKTERVIKISNGFCYKYKLSSQFLLRTKTKEMGSVWK